MFASVIESSVLEVSLDRVYLQVSLDLLYCQMSMTHPHHVQCHFSAARHCYHLYHYCFVFHLVYHSWLCPADSVFFSGIIHDAVL